MHLAWKIQPNKIETWICWIANIYLHKNGRKRDGEGDEERRRRCGGRLAATAGACRLVAFVSATTFNSFFFAHFLGCTGVFRLSAFSLCQATGVLVTTTGRYWFWSFSLKAGTAAGVHNGDEESEKENTQHRRRHRRREAVDWLMTMARCRSICADFTHFELNVARLSSKHLSAREKNQYFVLKG